MNRFIAYVYGRILGFFHFLVIASLGLYIYAIFSKHDAAVVSTIKTISTASYADVDNDLFFKTLACLIIFLIYAFFIGFVSTIVAINENLYELRRYIQSRDVDPGRPVVRREDAEPWISGV
jgi:hypothetical protein